MDLPSSVNEVNASDTPRTRRVGIITGSTSGVGRASAVMLADRGFDLILLGRNGQRGEAMRRRLARRHPSGRFRFIRCDLSNLASTRAAGWRIRDEFPSVDLLVNNAGARFDRYQESVDGFELTFATNHLGHFLLTCMVIGLLQAGGIEGRTARPTARILTVASGKHREIRQVRGWLVGEESYNRWDAYSRSKLANVLFAFELARRLEGTRIVSNVVDPGIVASRFALNNGLVPWTRHIVSSVIARQLVSSARAAEGLVHVADSDETASRTGRYFIGKAEREAAALARDRELAADLWRSSVEWSDLDRRECPAWTVIDPQSPGPRLRNRTEELAGRTERSERVRLVNPRIVSHG
jgi:NAD(P)-dependent dehydrogenase (short-subunit alcohol dehydrogenase family)